MHHFAEDDLVEKGQVVVELRKKLEEIEVARRKTILDAGKRDLDRTTKLFKATRSVSVEKMEEVQAKYDVALAEYETAAQQLKIREIAAPFSGRITNFYELEEGESVQIQTPLARLVDTTRCHFIAHVGSRLIGGLEKGGEVVLEFDTGSGMIRRPARVTLVSSVIDPSSGLLKVRAIFDNQDGAIRAGLDGEMLWKRNANKVEGGIK
ncbi:MAG: multidrug efflux system membrane fusion protein [Verrucomicrobiales bacterium]|jgi:multidrug efflux system membrane fusion protein